MSCVFSVCQVGGHEMKHSFSRDINIAIETRSIIKQMKMWRLLAHMKQIVVG